MDEDVGRSRGAAPAESAPALGPLIVQWELSLERLKLLGYESRYVGSSKARRLLHKLSFILPGSNPSHQFEDFVSISSWLCTEISGDPELFKRDQFDDPNAVVNKLLLALRKLDFRATFQPAKLKAAYGEAVCSALDFLTERAMAARRLEWSSPTYPDADKAEAAEDDEDDDEVVDEAAGEAPDEEQVFEESRAEAGEVSSDDIAAHQVLEAKVDPVEWKTELERVGPKLRAGQALSTNEWRAHVDLTVTSRGAIAKVLEDTRSDLAGLSKDSADELARMRTKEKYLNHQFSAICEEYAAVRRQLEELEAKSAASGERVARLTGEAAELGDKLEELKESFESRDSGASDASPLVRIKAALQQIKAEIQAFDLRIGVVSHSVLAARVASNSRRRVRSARSARQRGFNGARDAEDPNAALFEEDE